MPTAAMRTTTSFGPGSARSSSTTSRGSPTARKSPALVFTLRPIAAFTAAQVVTVETFCSAKLIDALCQSAFIVEQPSSGTTMV